MGSTATGLWRRKTVAEFAAEEAEDATSESKLSLVDLLCIGIGGTVGSGVFVLTGTVFPVAGPSSAVCWVVGGFICWLSAASYMELSTVVPTRGSTYAFAYHGLGEVVAVAGATSLTLEYGLSGAGVARSWSSKFADLVGASFFVSYDGHKVQESSHDTYLDFGAAIMQIACVLIVAAGVSLSKRVINTMTISKVILVIFLIGAGFSGTRRNVFEDTGTFFPDGVTGVAQGTSLLFFGFIGFDEVCCMAARCDKPRYAMPRAISGTLLGAAVLSTLAQLALAGLAPRDDDDDDGTSFEHAFRQRDWIWASYITSIGEAILLPLVVLLSFLPQPELMAALGHDGLVSQRFANLGGRNGDVYVYGCVVCGVSLTIVSLVVPFDVLWDTINLGVLIGFNITNAALIATRVGNGGACQDPVAARDLARYALLFAPGSAYLLWKGCLADVIDGRELTAWRVSALTFSLVLFVAGLVTLARIKTKLVKVTQALGASPASTGFRAPAVPWLPGAAIFLNCLLMAQYDWIEHAYLAGLYGAAYLVYFYSKCRNAIDAARRHKLDDADDALTGTSLGAPLITDDRGTAAAAAPAPADLF